MRSFFKSKQDSSGDSNQNHDKNEQPSEFNMPETPLSKYLDVNVQMIKEMTGDSSDIIIRRLDQALGKPVHVAVIYTDGLADEQIINNSILKSLTQIQADADCSLDPPKQVLGWIKHRFLAIGQVTDIDTMKKLFDAILAGNTVILVDGTAKGISASSAGGEQRGVDEPQSQTVIRGPREGFTENLRINTSLIRRKIKNPNLWIVDRTIGRVTQTDVAVMYIHGIASDNVVQEILRRLDRIDIDSVLESGYIEEFIQDATFTPFPTLTNSERPDAIAGAILEGKVAILVDGSPFVLIAPITIFKLFQSSEDYYQKFDIATFLRLMRIIAFVFSMLLPSMYIAITTFHQQMLPTTLLISLAAQREGVPFPAFVEALAMEITFEVLREAGVRMPRAIGSAISIVGALVLGQAAVQAGLVSAAMVIIVAFTAIAGFVAPSVSLSNSARLLRFGFMLLAATLGLFGIIAGLMAMLIHLAGLRSFGIPYLIPLAPFTTSDQKDSLVRVPWWAMIKRPTLISQKNVKRQKSIQKPSPSKDEQEQ
ncbi:MULTISPECIES: spore germination protein [Paenibacillus]|uniref:spore germination protein n=1 Tax=Paenibacillus TaxID=44249 RepID=UPI001F115A60|nr:spore germination protein [Paenibacillus favisporus]